MVFLVLSQPGRSFDSGASASAQDDRRAGAVRIRPGQAQAEGGHARAADSRPYDKSAPAKAGALPKNEKLKTKY